MKTPTKGQLVKAIIDIVEAEDARVRAYNASEDTSQYRADLENKISVASNLIGPCLKAWGMEAYGG